MPKVDKRLIAIALVAVGVLLSVYLLYPRVTPKHEARLPFKSFERYGGPILLPDGDGFDANAVYNPAIIVENRTFYMLFRAQEVCHGTSTIGLAHSTNGTQFEKHPKPIIYPEYDYEAKGGCEDPRIIKVNDTYYLTYTAYDGETARLALATSRDLINWTKCGPIFPEWGWSKSGAIVPMKINGKYYMYFGDLDMWIAHSEDLIHWTPEAEPVLRPRGGRFDSRLVEPGPPPIVLEDGILLIYNGADDNLRYSTGWVIFSKNDPRKVIARAEKPILEPTTTWEKSGQVRNVVFATGLVKFNNSWYLYYGAADTFVCLTVAEANGKVVESSFSVEDVSKLLIEFSDFTSSIEALARQPKEGRITWPLLRLSRCLHPRNRQTACHPLQPLRR